MVSRELIVLFYVIRFAPDSLWYSSPIYASSLHIILKVLQEVNSFSLLLRALCLLIFILLWPYVSLFDMWTLKLLWWNVRGLDDKFQRVLMFKYLNHNRPHILFVQETHLVGNDILALRRLWVQQAFHATYSGYAMGVAVLLYKSLAYKVIHLITDLLGRYILKLEIRAMVFAFC